MIKFAICDDEPMMAQALADRLAGYLKEHAVTDYTVRCFPGGRALLDSGGFDVVFLDIRMDQPDGLETARLLRRQGERSLVIFVTVLRECVFDAFGVEAFDYLLKPLDSARFGQTMDRVLRTLEQRAAADLVIRQGSGLAVVPLADIVYCEVLGRKLYLHKQDGTVMDYYGRLEELERHVDGRFFRCHRSYLVNLECVRGCQDGQVTLPQGACVPVSRLRERELTQALLRHLRKREI